MLRAMREQVQLTDPPMASGSATGDVMKNLKTLVAMDNVVTTLLQHKDHFMLKTLMPGLPKLNWQSNVGHVLDVALQALGLRRSKAGKELWTETAPEKLSYQETKAANSRQPKEQRQTVAGQLGDIDLSHDASAPAAGSRAAQAAAEAAPPPAAPQPLELISPDAGERIGRIGTGWGSTPRPLSACCVCESISASTTWQRGCSITRVHARRRCAAYTWTSRSGRSTPWASSPSRVSPPACGACV